MLKIIMLDKRLEMCYTILYIMGKGMLPLYPDQVYEKIFEGCVRIQGPMDTPCAIWTGRTNSKGYPQVYIGYEGGKQILKLAHRILYELEFGEIPEGMKICHHCDTPTCLNTHHMFMGTQADNIADMIAKGRAVLNRGGRIPKLILAWMKPPSINRRI